MLPYFYDLLEKLPLLVSEEILKHYELSGMESCLTSYFLEGDVVSKLCKIKRHQLFLEQLITAVLRTNQLHNLQIFNFT